MKSKIRGKERGIWTSGVERNKSEKKWTERINRKMLENVNSRNDDSAENKRGAISISYTIDCLNRKPIRYMIIMYITYIEYNAFSW